MEATKSAGSSGYLVLQDAQPIQVMKFEEIRPPSLASDDGSAPASATNRLPITILQDKTILLDVHHPCYQEARDALAPFSELEKAPEHVHTYCITPVSLWNAAAQGLKTDDIKIELGRYARHGIPRNLI